METPLRIVRDRETGDVLFLKKNYPPFKTNYLPMDSPKNTFVNLLSSKNEELTATNFPKVVATEQVLLNFENDYEFWQNYLCLKEKVPHQNGGQSKKLGEVAILSTPPTIIEDIKNLSEDVYHLSTEQEMLNMFKQENLL